MRERDWRVECFAICEREYWSAHWRGFGRSVREESEEGDEVVADGVGAKEGVDGFEVGVRA